MTRSDLPNVLVLGAMKCGTTSLHTYLDSHPRISMSTQKELNFFNREFDRGLEWYASHFDASAPIRGESTPQYTRRHLSSDIAARVHRTVPDCRFIYLVRDPIERAVSHYVHECAKNREHRPLLEVLAEPEANDYLLTGRYMFQLEPFLERFRDDQFLVLSSDELRRDRLATMNRIFAFLEVSSVDDPGLFDRIVHESAGKSRLRWPFALVRSVPGVAALSRAVMPMSLRDRFTRRGIDLPPIPQSLRSRLAAYFREDLRRLDAFVGRPLSASWARDDAGPH